MSADQLKQEMLALPLSERASLAQALWQSIGAVSPETDEEAAIADAIHRDQELSSGVVSAREHDQVMRTARRIVKCE